MSWTAGLMADPRRGPAPRSSRPPLGERNRVVVRLAMAALRGDASRVRGAVPGLDPPVGARVLPRQASPRRGLWHRAPCLLRCLVRRPRGGSARPERGGRDRSRNLLPLDNVDVVQGDLTRPPFRTASQGGGFDLVYSIGVLHHLPILTKGSIARSVCTSGGNDRSLGLWPREQRRRSQRRRADPTTVDEGAASLLRGLAWPLAVGFHGAAKAIYRPLHGTRLAEPPPRRVHVERRGLQLSPELHDRLRSARCAYGGVHQGP